MPKQFPDICGQVPTGPVLSQLDKCLATRNPSSPACNKVGDLEAACQDNRYQGSLVCQLVNRGPAPGTPSIPVPTLPVLPGLGRAGFGSTTSSATGVARPDSDLGALLVWGMVER